MKQLKWGSFTKTKNGEWNGLNNAAIYSFNGNIVNSFVREMFQNSIDARDKDSLDKSGKLKPLLIKINYKNIGQEDFPDFDGFYEIFKQIAGSSPNKSNTQFFNNAFKALGDKRKIPFFIYEDYNTVGLTGTDRDPEKSFNACVISEGISVKSESTAGGSFGIGKNAIYGLSQLRTVFYSSVDTDGNFVFQGKAKLASYYDSDGNTKDNKIYCGIEEEFRSIREVGFIADLADGLFTRELPGLSQYAICPIENDHWPEEFSKAILRNYWMLLEKGELEVSLYKEDELIQTIQKSNLEEMLLKYFEPDNYQPDNISPKGNPWEFYNCFKNGVEIISDNIEDLGNVKFVYNEIDNHNTNAVAFLRNDMVVYTESIWGFGSIGYSGIFLCNDDKGNEILRAMEPPTHDSFSADRLQEKHDKYSVKDGQRILNQIKELINSGLQNIKDKYTKPVEDINWLDDLLASLEGLSGSGSGDRTNQKSDEETTERMGKSVDKIIEFKTSDRNILINNENGIIEGKGGGGPKPPGSNPTSTPPRPGPNPGPTTGLSPIRELKISSRIFKTNQTKRIEETEYSVYRLKLNSLNGIQGDSDILIAQQGDSGSVVMFEIGDILNGDGQSQSFRNEYNEKGDLIGYRVNSVRVPSDLDISINEPYNSSFKIVKS